MFILSKLFTHLILPPGMFILMFVLLFVLALRKKQVLIACLAAISAVVMYLFSSYPARLLLRPLEYKYLAPENVECDAIVVLSGGVVRKSPESGRDEVDRATTRRLYTAYRLWMSMKKPILLSGGNVFSGGEPLSVVMKHFLLSLGVPDDYILVETKSRNTFENAIYSKKILDDNGWKKVCLVTSAFHMPRSYAIFKDAGLSVVPVPGDFTIGKKKVSLWSFLPSMGNFNTSYTAIHEYVGILYYKLIQRRR